PACIAVKSAELQSAEYGARYLSLARKAVMVESKNIARLQTLFDLAADLSRQENGFDCELFGNDLQDRGIDAFRRDWQEAKYRGITRFPTLVFKTPGRPAAVLSGYQTYETLKSLLNSQKDHNTDP
ncbi:MAG TPA: DsbA family protein, partial [Puia sp.]|nr:DsbA family protein [Puia sp.]